MTPDPAALVLFTAFAGIVACLYLWLDSIPVSEYEMELELERMRTAA